MVIILNCTYYSKLKYNILVQCWLVLKLKVTLGSWLFKKFRVEIKIRPFFNEPLECAWFGPSFILNERQGKWWWECKFVFHSVWKGKYSLSGLHNCYIISIVFGKEYAISAESTYLFPLVPVNSQSLFINSTAFAPSNNFHTLSWALLRVNLPIYVYKKTDFKIVNKVQP